MAAARFLLLWLLLAVMAEDTDESSCPGSGDQHTCGNNPLVPEKEPERVKVIVDCDPGVDDLLAIWWLVSAHDQGLIDLVAFTTVAGNIDSRTVHRNAAIGAMFFETLREHGVQFGTSGVRVDDEDKETEQFYGEDGLGGLTDEILASFAGVSSSEEARKLMPDFETSKSSPDLLIELLESNKPQSIIILAVGPLTNLAMAERKRPGILSVAREIIIMGGGFGFHGTLDGYNGRGNINALAEFNFWADAKSAKEVFEVGGRSSLAATLTLIPLDVTQQVCWCDKQQKLLTDSVTSMLQSNNATKGLSGENSPLVRLLGKIVKQLDGLMLEFAQRCIYLHDPAAVGYVIYPQLFHLRRVYVGVGTSGDFKGHTWTDLRPLPGRRANTWVTHGVEIEDFMMAMRRDFALIAATSAARQAHRRIDRK